MIVVNGCPKSGSHGLMALLDRMGLKRVPGTVLACTPSQAPHVAGVTSVSLATLRVLPDTCYALGHVCAHHAQALDGMTVLSVVRDPRDVLISYQRHRLREDGIVVSVADALESFWGAPFVSTYRGFLGWRGKAVLFRYEDLPGEVVGDGGGIYCSHDRRHNTRTGTPSDWRRDWTQEDRLTWCVAGGSALAREAGY